MTCHTTTCVRLLEMRTKPAREQARKDRTDQERGIGERDLMSGRVAEEMTEERKEAKRAPRAASLTGTVTRTKEALETMAKVKAGNESQCCHDCGGQRRIGVNCPYK